MLPSRLFRVLLRIDLWFIALHLALVAADAAGISEMNSLFNIGSESSVPSLYLHCKWLAAALLLFRAGQHGGGRPAYALALVASLLFVDDTLQIHEELGDLFAHWLHLPSVLGADPDDLGELVAVGGVGLICVIAMGYAYLNAALVDRRAILMFVLLFVLLGTAGVGVDFLHSAMPEQFGWALGALEDGGEMVIGSGLVALASAILRDVDLQADTRRERAA